MKLQKQIEPIRRDDSVQSYNTAYHFHNVHDVNNTTYKYIKQLKGLVQERD